VLRPGGLLHFTSFGPDTLKELRSAWAAADAYTHVNRFIDMHDLGDAMLRAGLAEPVMDVERYTLTYPDVGGLMRDLKAIGAHNVNAGRSRGLTGRYAIKRMTAAYEDERREGRLPATFEVVFGQAWAPVAPQRPRAAAGETRIPVSRIGRRN
jgi:malonyl-CoA O-methyltransferase